MRNKTLQPYVWIFTSGFAFSWMAIMTPLAGRACSWPTVAIMRCLIPLVVIAVWAKWDGVKLVVWGSPVLWMRSLAGSCSLIGTFSVLASVHVTHLQVTDIYTICNIFPIWVALLSWPMLGRFPSGVVWLSIFSSVAGVAIIQGRELQTGNYAALIVVAVSIFTALAMLGLNRLKNIDPRAVVVHFSATGLVFALVCFLVFPTDAPPDAFEMKHLFELLGIGVTASIGQYFLTKAFTAGDPAKISVATLSQFVFVLLLDVLVLRNPLDWHKLWGIPLIIGPTVWLMLQRVQEFIPHGRAAGAGPRAGRGAVARGAPILRFPANRRVEAFGETGTLAEGSSTQIPNDPRDGPRTLKPPPEIKCCRRWSRSRPSSASRPRRPHRLRTCSTWPIRRRPSAASSFSRRRATSSSSTITAPGWPNFIAAAAPRALFTRASFFANPMGNTPFSKRAPTPS